MLFISCSFQLIKITDAKVVFDIPERFFVSIGVTLNLHSYIVLLSKFASNSESNYLNENTSFARETLRLNENISQPIKSIESGVVKKTKRYNDIISLLWKQKPSSSVANEKAERSRIKKSSFQFQHLNDSFPIGNYLTSTHGNS